VKAPRWWNAPRVVCAWCQVALRFGGLLSFFPRRAAVSHGICQACRDQALQEWRDRRRKEAATR